MVSQMISMKAPILQILILVYLIGGDPRLPAPRARTMSVFRFAILF